MRDSPPRSRCWRDRLRPRSTASPLRPGRHCVALYELIEQPDLDEPVVVLALEGWIDAGLAAGGAAETLCDVLDTVTVARFSTDELLDYRARRPIAHLVDGVLRGLTWPSLEIRAATDTAGRDLLLVIGAEPDRLWQQFTDEVVTLALEF